MKYKNQIWTDSEVKILKENYLKYNQRELSEKFFPTKTPVQICQKKMSMGLKKPPVWTNSERALLLEHGADYEYKELTQKFFPNKRPLQVCWMRKHLGIRRKK